MDDRQRNDGQRRADREPIDHRTGIGRPGPRDTVKERSGDSPARSPRRERSKTPQPVARSSPTRDRAPTPTESDAISFYGSPRSDTEPAVAKERARTVDTSGDAATSAPALSILGAARRLRSEAEQEGARIIDVEPAPKPSSTMGVPNVAYELPEPARTDTVSTSLSRASAVGPSTDLRAKLQARLTAEYRAALLSRNQNGTGSRSTGPPASSSNLRDKLRERLLKEKEFALAERERERTGGDWREDGRGHDGSDPVAARSATTTTFSDETRRMLLARLEEEKAYLAVSGGEREYDAFDDDGAAVATAGTEDTATTPVTGSDNIGLSAEERLKHALAAKKHARQLEELERRTGELKEKLVRAKLLKARQAAKVNGA